MTAVALGDVKDYLGIKSTDYDAKLTGFLKGAEAALASEVGYLTLQPAATRTLPGCGRDALVLPTAPINSLTSVTPVVAGADALDLTTLTLDQFGGFIKTVDGSWFHYTSYSVIYVAGWDVVPDDLVLAVKEKVRGMWNLSQRGSGNRPGQRGSLPDTPPDVLVDQLIEPYRLVRIGAA